MVAFLAPLIPAAFSRANLDELLTACQRTSAIESCELICAIDAPVENGYCAAADNKAIKDDPIFAEKCVFGERCISKRGYTDSLDEALTIKTIKGGAHFDEAIETLPEAVQQKLGTGNRKQYLDIDRYAGWACQGWGQLTDLKGQSVFNAKGYAYDGESETCHLLKKRVEGSDVKAKQGRRVHRNGVFGVRSVGCDDDKVKCSGVEAEELPADVADCVDKNTFDWTKCTMIDALSTHADAIYCVAGGKSMFETGLCGVIEAPEKAYKPVNHAVTIPRKHFVIGSTEDDLRDFLIARGDNFADFAGKVGFEEPQGPFGVRPQLMAMKRGGAMACRAVLRLKGSKGKMIAGVDAFFFDKETEECFLFKETDFEKENEKKLYEVGPIFV